MVKNAENFQIFCNNDEYEKQLPNLYYECFRNDEVYKNENDDIYMLTDLSTNIVVASLTLTRENEGEASIWSVCCAKEYRRKGLTKKLITSVINDPKNTDTDLFWLMVDSDNNAAISLYFCLGFEMDVDYNKAESKYRNGRWDSEDSEYDNVYYKMFLLRNKIVRKESGLCQIL